MIPDSPSRPVSPRSPPKPSPPPGSAVTVEVEVVGTEVVVAAPLVDGTEDVEVGETVVDDGMIELEVAPVVVVGAGVISSAIAQSSSAVRPPSCVLTITPSPSMKTSLGNPSMS